MANFRDLPKDLAEEILYRVPNKNLNLVRSTCKDWDRLFNNKSFATKHFDNSPKEFLPLLLTNDFVLCPMSIDVHGDVPSVEVKNPLNLVNPDCSNLYEYEILRVFHCEGLLLCTTRDESWIVVWNPCTGQTRWIQAGDPRDESDKCRTFLLGYCQDEKSCVKSYKILSFYCFGSKDSAIYELTSDSWRTLDHDIGLGWSLSYYDHYLSLKGDAYMFATDEATTQLGLSILRFDFKTEKFVHVPLPCNGDSYIATSLSVVREEKLSVLKQRDDDSMTEIWVSNKIDETKVVSWSKVVAFEFIGFNIQTSHGATFLLDEEKAILVLCGTWTEESETVCLDMVYIFSDEYSKVTTVNLGVNIMDSSWPTIFNYVPSLVQIDVPSLVQIEGAGGNIRKRGE